MCVHVSVHACQCVCVRVYVSVCMCCACMCVCMCFCLCTFVCKRCDTYHCLTCAKVSEQLSDLLVDCNEAQWFCHTCNPIAVEAFYM